MTAVVFGIILGFNVAIWLAIGNLRTRVDKMAQSILTLCEGLMQTLEAMRILNEQIKRERGQWN